MRRFIVLLAALPLSHASAIPQLIYDASDSLHSPKVSTPELLALKRLYGAKGVKTCGDFAVNFRQDGQFTAERRQTLYLVQNCYDDGAANPMRTRYQSDLLILDGTRLNFFKVGFTDTIAVLPALGAEKLNALLTEIWFGPHMGEFVSAAQIQHFSRGQFRTLLDIGPTYLDMENDGTTASGTATRRTLWFDAAHPYTLKVMDYRSPYSGEAPGGDTYNRKLARKVLTVEVDLRHPPTGQPWQEGP